MTLTFVQELIIVGGSFVGGIVCKSFFTNETNKAKAAIRKFVSNTKTIAEEDKTKLLSELTTIEKL